MFGTIRGRLIVIVLIVGGVITAWVRNHGVKLGLDLQGGMYLALEVKDPDGTLTPQQKADATDQNLEILRNRINQFGVVEPLIQKVGSDRIIVQLPGIRDEARARGIIDRQAYLQWTLVRPTLEFRNALGRMDRLVAQGLGPREPAADTTAQDTTGQGQRQSLTEALFGRTDSTAADSTKSDSTAAPAATSTSNPLSSLLLDSGSDGEFLVNEQDVEKVKQYLALPGVEGALPRGTELRWGRVQGQGAQLYRSLYFLDSKPFITGDRLRNATAGRDPQYNKTIVTFELDRRGGRTFEDVTSQHINDRIAIVLDSTVYSAPVVISRIGANGQIDMGQAPMQEASDLALVLRAGALAQPLEIVDQRTVGPSLGQDSIDQGKLAGIIGVLAVVLIMILYYRFAGVLAVAALALYIILVLGGLAALGASLTAPGIAGMILSLGMAVDANVLIFERTREELIGGRSTRAAVDEGFKNAMSAIVDSNITTLITALILYKVGTGPVQGFAVTLSIGIVASFFTAVFITRTFFLIYLARKRPSEPISI